MPLAFVFRKSMLRGHPGRVTLAVRRVIVRGVNHGLVVTATTDGQHSATSYHKTKPLGRAVDLGVAGRLVGTPAATMREVAFQRYLLHRFGAKAFLELYGPANDLSVKNGVQFTLPEGVPLETLHDNHVHVVPARVFRLPRKPKPKLRTAKVAKSVSLRGAQFVARFEGFRAKAYKPVPAERFFTIGYGHYGEDVKPGSSITRAKAMLLLRADLKKASKAVKLAFPHLNQNQHDAITSAVFNMGSGVLAPSRSLGSALGRGRGVREALALYVHGADGKVLPGLVIRRAAEAALFNTPVKEK